MIKNILFKKLFSAISIFTVLLNLMLPLFIGQQVYAQEVTPVPVPTQVTSTPLPESSAIPAAETPAPTPASSIDSQPAPTVSPSPEVTPDATNTSSPVPTVTPTQSPAAVPDSLPTPTPTPTPAPELTPSPEVTPSAFVAPAAVEIWQDSGDGKWETINNVVVGEEYSAPQNDKVKVKFTGISVSSGKLSIKEVKLTAEQVSQTGALSETAYEITSTMADSTFFYDLTLPIPPEAQNKEIDVKSSETVEEAGNAQKVAEPEEKVADTITIHGLNHFTVFILTTPNPDTTQRVLINEIAPTAGTEWVELYNNGTASVNLAAGTGWVIRNSAGNSQSLSALGTIAPAGRAVFNAPAGWLLDVAPETVSILNELGSTIDTVTVSLTAPGFAVDHYPLATESVGRKTDGISEWIIFTIPSKGTANILPVPTTGLAEVGSTSAITTFPTWYKDTNGLALDLMEAADTNGISAPIDAGNAFSSQIGFGGEGFWFSADASIPTAAGSADLIQGVEASFAPSPTAVDGLQSAFARIRIRVDVTDPGTYTVTYPYGQKTYVVTTPGTRAINDTVDIGCFDKVACNSSTTPNYSTVLTGEIGPFVTWDTFDPDPTLSDPLLTNAATGRRYVGLGTTDHAIKGSPTGNNFFRVEGPNIGGPGVNSIETTLFTVTGRLADANAPVITLFGANPVNAVQNSIYTDAGATAIDDLGGNLTGNIAVTGLPVDTSTLGAKTVTYTVTDSAGRTSVATRTVNVVEGGGIDVTAPVITLLGGTPVDVTQGTPYIDAGATALDNVDGDITGSIVTTNPVNTAVIGSYTVTYNVLDAAGNPATEVTRTVNVVADTVAPIITITGSNPVNLLTGAPYTDSGATATDNVDGDMTADIITTGLPIDTAAPGSFTVTYTVTDAAGNSANAIRTVNVVNTIPGSLAAVSTINPVNGYPTWYKDSAGVALQLCLGLASGLADPNCVLPTVAPLEPNYDPTQPIIFPTNFPGESFWYIADTDVAPAGQAGAGRVRLRYALEGAFTTPTPAVDQQIAFLRVNLQRIEDLIPGADYTVTHPFGQFTVHAGDALLPDGLTPNPDAGVADDGRFFRLEDGAFAAPLTDVTAASFLSAVTTRISKFLKQTNPLPPAGYIGDGVTLSTIESGPNGNFVRIEGPSIDVGNYDGDGNPNMLTINLWTVAGKLADTAAPVITLIGANPVDVTQNTIYTDAGATALDDFDGNVTASIVTTGLPVDTTTVGAKSVTYTVTDRAGNSSSVTRTVNVTGIDTTAPVITRLGTNPASVVVGSVYTDAGATALDNLDGDITANIVTVNPVNSSIIGAYTVTYNVSDVAGNPATEVTRTVNVIAAPDITAPVITRLGVDPVSVTAGSAYVDAGATALDDIDGVITANIVTVNPVNTAVIGSYIVTYNVSDAAGNPAAEVTRTVDVVAPVDIISPVITVLGANPVDVTVGTAYVDAGATALDNVDGNITANIVATGLPINTSAVGSFTVTYSVFDAALNLGTATRTVNVVAAPPVPDTTAPIITRLGVNPVDVTVGTAYVDAGATALDNVDGNITANIVTTNPVNTAVIGSYTVTYNVSDAAGNPAIEVTRTVNVVAAPPVPTTASISGLVFQDTDTDRIKDAGEPVLPGWTLYLDANTNRVFDAGETSVVSDALGNYQFLGLLPGTYSVNEVKQVDWAIRLPGDNGYTQTVVAGDNITGRDFGNIVTRTVNGQGGFATTTGTTLTPSVVSVGDSVINVSSNGGTSTVTVPADTIITASTGEVFDATTLAASDPAGELISGLGSGVVVNGKLQWGIPNLGLVFSTPITLEIFVGAALNGQTLSVLRSVDGTSNWTSDGIVDPKKCIVAAGICSFQATKASYYVAANVPVAAANNSNNSSGSSSSSGGGDGLSDGLGCASRDCSIHPVASLQGQASAGSANDFTAGVLGVQTGEDNFGTGTGGPIIEESPSPSPEVLGDGNVGIGLGQQAGIGGQSFLGFVQTQTSLLGILAGLVLLFVLNIFHRRA